MLKDISYVRINSIIILGNGVESNRVSRQLMDPGAR